jgi:hypothetical protein
VSLFCSLQLEKESCVFRPCLISALVLVSAAADQTEKPYQLPTPKGWRTEHFPLPPTFAPDMTWKGAEELRFAPGMFKANAPDFFSYAMLFWLPADAGIDAKTLERELLAYYRGLASAVSKSKKREVDTKAFSLTISEQQGPHRDPERYTGVLKWTEPFATNKSQTLRLEIEALPSAQHKCLFICASAQPETAAVWKTLHQIRAGCTCR